jgi:guanylate kinase
MGELYLRGARCVVLYERHVVWQIQLAKNVYLLPDITGDLYCRARKRAARKEEQACTRLAARRATMRAPHRRRIERL